MKLLLLGAMVGCISIQPINCGHPGRPTGCITNAAGELYEFDGVATESARNHCGSQLPCVFTPYNQAAPDLEFEAQRDICRPKPPCLEACTPVS